LLVIPTLPANKANDESDDEEEDYNEDEADHSIIVSASAAIRRCSSG